MGASSSLAEQSSLRKRSLLVGGQAGLSRKGLGSVDRRLFFTCVCLGVPPGWAGG